LEFKTGQSPKDGVFVKIYDNGFRKYFGLMLKKEKCKPLEDTN
jgi:hypothetical protein